MEGQEGIVLIIGLSCFIFGGKSESLFTVTKSKDLEGSFFFHLKIILRKNREYKMAKNLFDEDYF